jgi:hypothetical protein
VLPARSIVPVVVTKHVNIYEIIKAAMGLLVHALRGETAI